MLLSLLTPGLGELYAGRPRRGAMTFAITVVVANLAWFPVFWAGLGVFSLILPLVTVLGCFVFIIWRAVRAARAAPDPYPVQGYNHWFVYVLAILVQGFAVQPLLVTTIRHRGVEAFRIPAASMEPTILVGDFILVDRRAATRLNIGRNDIVVFQSVTTPGMMIMKRAVGVPGDTLQMRNGTLFVDGRQQDERYVQRIDPAHDINDTEMLAWQAAALLPSVNRSSYQPSRDNWGPLVVPAASYFILGDNRDNSYDSRWWGFVPAGKVVGKPLVIYFSLAAGGTERIGLRFEGR